MTPPKKKHGSSVTHWLEEQVVVPNQAGIHARPAGLMAELANRFSSDIAIRRGDVDVNAKSLLHLLTLVAEQGTVLTIRAAGEDAEEAARAMAELIGSGFGEEM